MADAPTILEGDDAITARLQSLVPAPIRERIPPPVIVELQGKLKVWVPGKSLTAHFPPQPRFSNVAGAVQGGILIAGLDAVMGCLSFLECGAPCTSLGIQTNFVRPILPEDGDFQICATFKTRTKSLSYVHGEVLSPDGTPAVIANMSMMILDPERMAKKYES